MKNVSNTDANIAVVQNIYAAFLRGDMPTMLGALAPDIDWESHGPQKDFPLFGPRLGIDDVKQFFADLAETNEFSEFSPNEFFADGDKVVVLGHYAFTLKPTGRKVATPWAMVFTIRDGKVTKFREHTDSAKFVEANRR